MVIKQLSVFVENRLGRMAEIATIIGEAGVDIRALSIADTSDFGILRIIVNKPEAAVLVLSEAGITVTLTDVIGVGVPDRPGSFAQVVQVLSDQGIGIDYMYAFVSRVDGEAFIILRVEHIEDAIKALEAAKIRMLSSVPD